MEDLPSRIPKSIRKSLADTSVLEIFTKALRRKTMVASITFLVVAAGLAVYALRMNPVFERTIVLQFNNSGNNLFFSFIDSLVPGTADSNGKSLDFTDRSLASLDSDQFVDFIIKSAESDSALADLIGYKKSSDNHSRSARAQIRGNFFSSYPFLPEIYPEAALLRKNRTESFTPSSTIKLRSGSSTSRNL